MLTALIMVLTASAALAKISIFCYHEVDRPGDEYAVTTSALHEQFSYLKNNGYHFVDLDEYIRFARGEVTLPEKSVMITFDDGYSSFYTKVYPLLKQYNIPAMLGIVTSWTDGEGAPGDVRGLATWEELREMEKSGLVTVVSHTHALHKQQSMTPQGDYNGVAGYHLYMNGRYETNEEYMSRLTADFNRAQELFVEHLGHKSRAVVWPYGIYSAQSLDGAFASGAEVTFRLDGGAVTEPGDAALRYATRMIMSRHVTLKVFRAMLGDRTDEWNEGGVRLAQVDIDSIYDKDPVQFNRNISDMIDQLNSNAINAVALQVFADPEGNGNIEQVYFPNSVVPVVDDVFGHVATALMQQNITVLAWIPTLTYQNLIAPDGSNAVQSTGEKGWYKRISPFDEVAMKKVETLYRELATYSPADGILFQDDLYLNDFEDVSAPAAAAYRAAFGTELAALDKNDKQAVKKWTQLKTKKLTDLSLQMAAAFKERHPQAIIMRDIYTDPVLHPESVEWFAQDYQDFLKNYDFTVVMAYPYMDKADDTVEYLQSIGAAIKRAGGADKSIIKIQSYDWDKERWIGAKNFKSQMGALEKAGFHNLGYYPNTFYDWAPYKVVKKKAKGGD